jgi:hypothetical protein
VGITILAERPLVAIKVFVQRRFWRFSLRPAALQFVELVGHVCIGITVIALAIWIWRENRRYRERALVLSCINRFDGSFECWVAPHVAPAKTLVD